MTATKQNGEDYEPDNFKLSQFSINRFLAEKGSTVNIVEDREFKLLVSKRKMLKQQGRGNKERRADPFTPDEIEILYSKNFLGGGELYG